MLVELLVVLVTVRAHFCKIDGRVPTHADWVLVLVLVLFWGAVSLGSAGVVTMTDTMEQQPDNI